MNQTHWLISVFLLPTSFLNDKFCLFFEKLVNKNTGLFQKEYVKNYAQRSSANIFEAFNNVQTQNSYN